MSKKPPLKKVISAHIALEDKWFSAVGQENLKISLNQDPKKSLLLHNRGKKFSAKQGAAEDDDGAANGITIGSQSASENTQSDVDYSQWYAQATPIVASDANPQSNFTTSASTTDSIGSNGSEVLGGLSNGTLAILGIIGAGGVVAVVASNQKNSTSTAPDTSSPTIQNVSANSVNKTIILSYNEALDLNHLPLASAFNISNNGIINSVTGVTVEGNVLTLTLESTLSSGALIISYNDPSGSNDSNAIQDLSGNDADSFSFTKGIVADGYINGAEIYLDLNRNGFADPNEATGITTNQDGSFFLSSSLPDAPIITKGGVNMDTKLPQLTPLKAPAGASTINPLTTLVLSLIEQAANNHEALSLDAACALVANTFGISIPSGLSLLDYDPLAQNNASGLEAQKVAAQIATIINIAAQSDADIAGKVMANLAEYVLTSNGSAIDLGTLSQVDLNGLLAGTNITDSAPLISTIANANVAIKNAVGTDDISSKQILVAQDAFYIDSSPPLPLQVELYKDTGISASDNISSNGVIKVKPHYTEVQTALDDWFYRVIPNADDPDSSVSAWIPGTGNSFTLLAGTYSANHIQVKAIDAAGNESSISKIATSITIINNELTPATLTLVNDTGIANDQITADGAINIRLSPTAISWSYSTDHGATWVTSSSPTSFIVPQGTYAVGAIELKQLDIAGHSNIAYFESGLTVTTAEIADRPPVRQATPDSIDTKAPSMVNMIVSVGSNTVDIIFNEVLGHVHLPNVSEFTLSSSGLGEPPSVTNVAISGSTISLTLDRAITNADMKNGLLISYTDANPSDHVNAIQDAAGNALRISYTDANPSDQVNAIQDATGNAISTFSHTENSDALLLARIKSFALTLIESTSNLDFPIVGNLGVADLEKSILNEIDTQFANAVAMRDATPAPVAASPMAMSSFSASLPLGYTADYSGDLFEINWSSNTYLIKVKGLWNFGALPLASNLGFNWGEDNTLLKMGVNVDAEVNTVWNIDMNLAGGWKNSPLDSNFDAWLNQTVITPATATELRTLSGSYLATSIEGQFSGDASISGNLGPLTTSATNQDYFNPNIGNSGDSYQSQISSGLYGFAEVYLKDSNGYNLDDLLNIGTNFGNSFDVYYGVNSQLALDVRTGLDFNSALDKIFPELTFDLFTPLNFAFTDGTRAITNPDQTANKVSAYDNENNNGWVYLDNISLGVGDLINTLISPLTNFVDPVLQKFKPIVDFLQYDIVGELADNAPSQDWFSKLIKNVVGAIDWLPGVDIDQPSPPPTINQLLIDSLLSNYDQVNMSNGESGVVRVIDIFDGVTTQMRDALPTLEPLMNAQPWAASLHKSISDALPYLQGSIAIMREVSDFMSNYYDFVATEDQLVNSQYALDFGTLAINVSTGEFETSKFSLPWVTASPAIAPMAFNADIVENINVQSEAPASVDPATGWQQLMELGGKIGLDLTFLSNSTDFVNALMNKPANLITFKPNFDSLDAALSNIDSDIQLVDLMDAAASIPALAFLIPAAKFIDFPLSVTPDLSIIPRIEAGIDNYAIINKSDPNVTIWDSLYLSDKHLNASGQLVDLPELEASIDLTLKAFLGAGVKDLMYASVGAGLGISSDWGIDLVDPNGDGKVRGSEILNLPNFSGNADLIGQVYGNIDTFWTDKNYRYDAFNINLFNFDTAAQPVLS